MIESLCRWLYRRNTAVFHDLLIEDFYGTIPESLKEPSVEFLCNAKDKLERFWSIQAYTFQRRSIMADPKEAGEYKGVLIYIKSMLILLSKGAPSKKAEVQGKKEKDPVEGVMEFVRLGKERNKPKPDVV